MHNEKDMIEVNLSAGACEATASGFVKNIHAMTLKSPIFHIADGNGGLVRREENIPLGGRAGESTWPQTDLSRLYCADCQQRLKADTARFARISLCCFPVVPLSLLLCRYGWRRGATGGKGICKDCDRNLSS